MGAASQFKAVKGHRYLYRRGSRYYFRRFVPPSMRAAFEGRAEVQITLGDVSLAKARQLLAKALEVFESTLEPATVGISPLPDLMPVPSKDEVDAAVREWWKERTDKDLLPDFADNDGFDTAKKHILELEAVATDIQRGIAFGAASPALGTEWIAEALAERHEWRIDAGSPIQRHLARAIGRGQMEWARQRIQDIKGEPRTSGDAFFAPDQYRLDSHREQQRADAKAVSIRQLFSGYLEERAPAPATAKSYHRFVEALITFVGHDDALKIKPEDVVRWKDHLLTQPKSDGTLRSSKTVSDTYLSSVKTVFQWGFENHHISENPASRVRVRARRTVQVRSKGFLDNEARLILAATFREPSTRWSPERKFAHRWVPWLCAYTGARVDEVAQLRSQDVQKHEGIWCILITPEAGSTKNHAARLVPLHPHLIESGFVDEVAKRKGNLFFDPSQHRGGSNAHRQSKKVGQRLCDWVRELGIEGVAPNHGWRHRFKTQARFVDMDREMRDAIQGHAPKTEGEAYGDFPVRALMREIEKLPRYEIA